MAQTIRVSLPGYNALTDNNPDHFALYADQDWVLIKEKERNQIYVNNSTQTIPHGLGYPPFYMAYAYNVGYGKYIWCYGANFNNFIQTYSDNNYLYFKVINNSSTFYYYIFYDNI
jgi:hypothetical protein